MPSFIWEGDNFENWMIAILSTCNFNVSLLKSQQMERESNLKLSPSQIFQIDVPNNAKT